MVINVDDLQQLEALTIEAVKACSIRMHLHAGEGGLPDSPFSPDMTVEERLRNLGKALGQVCALSGEGAEKHRLSTALIRLAALAAIWAEVADKQQSEPVIPGWRKGVQHHHRPDSNCAGFTHRDIPGGDVWLG